MADVSNLSDADLLAALKSPEPTADPSKLSDEELMHALGQAPEMTTDRAAGLTGRTLVQAVPGAVLGLPALAADVIVGVPTAAGHAARRAVGLPEVKSNEPFFATSGDLAALGEWAADKLGLPKPVTLGEKFVTGTGQAVAETLGGSGLAKLGAKVATGAGQKALEFLAADPGKQAALAGLVGAGGEIADQNGVNPLIGAGLGLAAGVGGMATATGARRGVTAAREALDRAVPRSDEAIARAASEELRGRFTDPDAARAALEAGAGREYVPGSKPTTFQATGDLGAGALERELQTDNRDLFAARRGEQNAAQLDTLRAAGGQGQASDVVTFLRSQLDDIDASTARAEAQARRAAETAADGLRTSSTPEEIGERVRGAMSEAERSATARERALWDAVDPDGNLTVSTQGVKQTASEIFGNMTKAGELGVSGPERAVASLILEGYGPTVPFSELKDLGTRVKEAARTELRTNGQTQTYARLTRLSSAVRDAMSSAAAADPVAATRIGQLFEDFRGRGAAANSGDAGALRARAVSSVSPAQGARGGGSGAPAGAERARPKVSLAQFIAKNGGLPLDAEAAARDFGSWRFGRNGALARADGRSIDGYWRTKLIESGYLPKDPDGYASRDITKELFDALEEERAGRKRVMAQDEAHLAGDAAADNAEHGALVKQVREQLADAGIDPRDLHGKAVDDAAELLMRGDERDAVTAYERAVMGLEDADAPSRSFSYEPNTRPSAGAAYEGYNPDPDLARRYRAATTATREKYNTYRRGPAGQVLRRGEEAEQFRMSPASVTKNAFAPGPTGGERIRALVAAGARPADIAEAAALSMQRYLRDGVLDQRGFTAWRRAHEAAFRELPQDVRARFSTAALATHALQRATEARTAALDGYRKTVLGKLAQIDPADLGKHVAGILNAKDGVAQMKRLVDATRGNAAAREGLRKAVAEHILEKLVSNKEVATSGVNRIKADAFASFITSKEPLLRLVFDSATVARFKAIALDIRRAERSLDAVRIPNTSNTASDISHLLDKAADKAGKGSLLTQMLLGYLGGGVTGAIGIGATHIAGSARATAKAKVNDLILAAMLDPEKAKALLTVAPLQSKPAQELLRRKLGRLSILPAASAAGVGQ